MKKNIEKLVRKMKNPNFSFDQNVKSYTLCSLVMSRAICYLRSFRLIFYLKFPKRLFLGRSVSFFNVPNIVFGDSVTLGDYVHLNALGSGHLSLGNRVSIGAFSRLVISTTFNNIGKFITIGNNVGMGEYCYIGGGGGVDIGDNSIIGQYLSIHPENHVCTGLDSLIKDQGVTREGVSVGSNCWIGSKVTFLDGSRVGSGCVVAAGSVVNKKFGDNLIIAGVPARIIKNRAENEKNTDHSL